MLRARLVDPGALHAERRNALEMLDNNLPGKRRITVGGDKGFNLKAKLVKRRAYGYRSFRNYRLRLLNACA